MIGTQFQLWTEYIRDRRSLEYMAFPHGSALAEVAWTGRPATWAEEPNGGTGGPSRLPGRLAAHLGRLDAMGIEYRPLDGPRPWQRGGAGPRRSRPGYPVTRVAAYLARMAGEASRAPGDGR